MRFILVRHGETEWNATGQYQGQTDIPLSETGRAQAAALGKRFETIHVDAVYSSPLQRAYDTARAIAEPKGLLIQKVEGFKELISANGTARPRKSLRSASESPL